MQKYCVIFLINFLILAFIVPDTIYWRDSSEFVLSANYLDISHPAGYPLYSQLANLFSLLPIGSTTWRVNLFSSLLLALCITLTCRCLLVLKPSAGRWIALPVIIAWGIPFFIKQAFLSEVYVLYAVLLQVLFLLFAAYLKDKDVRFIYLSAFLSGLSLGNHVAIGLAILPIFIFLAIHFKKSLDVVAFLFVFGLLGLSIYSYIFVRASSDLPLNTGNIKSAESFLVHISNRRDKLIRLELDNKNQEDSKEKSYANEEEQLSRFDKFKLAFNLYLANFKKDAAAIFSQINYLGVSLSLIGLLLLIKQRNKLLLLILLITFSNYCFFISWNPDPWTGLYCMLILLESYAVISLLQSTKNGQLKLLFSICLLLVFSYQILKSIPAAAKIRTDFSIAEKASKKILRELPVGEVFISQESWFLLKYLQFIEYYRDDLLLVYQEQIFHPEHFNQIHLKGLDGSNYSNDILAEVGQSDMPLSAQRFINFLKFISKYKRLYFEPNNALLPFFREMTQIDEFGNVFVVRGEKSSINQNNLSLANGKLLEERLALNSIWAPLLWETQHYLDFRTINMATFFEAVAGIGFANKILEEQCMPSKSIASKSIASELKSCGIEVINQLAVQYINVRKFSQALDVLLDFYNKNQEDLSLDSKRAMLNNISIALQNMPSNERDIYQTGPNGQILKRVLM